MEGVPNSSPQSLPLPLSTGGSFQVPISYPQFPFHPPESTPGRCQINLLGLAMHFPPADPISLLPQPKIWSLKILFIFLQKGSCLVLNEYLFGLVKPFWISTIGQVWKLNFCLLRILFQTCSWPHPCPLRPKIQNPNILYFPFWKIAISCLYTWTLF